MSESAPAGQSGGAVPVTLGQIVEILRGRDSHAFAVVVGEVDERLVLLADGDKRKVDSPKKKNRAHVRATGAWAEEILACVQTGARVTNAKLRHCLRRFQESRESQPDPVVKEE